MVAAVRYRFWLCPRHFQHEHVYESAPLGIHSKMAAVIQHEIADVLFIDVVGYSKRSINEQRAALTSRAKSFRAITKVGSKLKHGGSKSKPEQTQSALRRSLCSPTVINFGQRIPA